MQTLVIKFDQEASASVMDVKNALMRELRGIEGFKVMPEESQAGAGAANAVVDAQNRLWMNRQLMVRSGHGRQAVRGACGLAEGITTRRPGSRRSWWPKHVRKNCEPQKLKPGGDRGLRREAKECNVNLWIAYAEWVHNATFELGSAILAWAVEYSGQVVGRFQRSVSDVKKKAYERRKLKKLAQGVDSIRRVGDVHADREAHGQG